MKLHLQRSCKQRKPNLIPNRNAIFSKKVGLDTSSLQKNLQNTSRLHKHSFSSRSFSSRVPPMAFKLPSMAQLQSKPTFFPQLQNRLGNPNSKVTSRIGVIQKHPLFEFNTAPFHTSLCLLAKVKKKVGETIKLSSMAGTGYFYTTNKPYKLKKKLMLRKYDPVVNQHVLFKEEKISRTKRPRKK